MNKFDLAAPNVLREIYLAGKAVSDEIREKHVHFTWEKLSDSIGTALGRIRKYTTNRSSDAALYGAFGRSSTTLLLLTSQTSNIGDVFQDLFKSTVQFFAESRNALAAPAAVGHSQIALPAELAAKFTAAQEFVSDDVAQAIKDLEEQNAIFERELDDIAAQKFIGPLTEQLHKALKNVDCRDHRFEIAQKHLGPSRHTDGIYKIGDEFAVTAEKLTALRDQFDETCGSQTCPVWRLDPIQQGGRASVTRTATTEPVPFLARG